MAIEKMLPSKWQTLITGFTLLMIVATGCAADDASTLPSFLRIRDCERLTGGGFMEAPVLASNGGDSAWIAWLSREPCDKEQVLARTYRGSWLPAISVTPSPGMYESPRIACQPNGNPVAVWVTIKGERWLLESSVYKDGKFGKPTEISSRQGKAANPALACSADGLVWAVWESYEKGKFKILLSRFSRGRWGNPITVITGDHNAYDPAVAVDCRSGKVWIAYSAVDNQTERSVFLVSYDGKAGRLGTRVPVAVGGKLPDAPNRNSSPSLLCDAKGRVWITYECDSAKRQSFWEACHQGDRECSVVCYWKGKLWAVKPESEEYLGRDVMTGMEDYLPILAHDSAGRMLLFSRLVRSKDTYGKDEQVQTQYYFRASVMDGPNGWTTPGILLDGKDYEIGDVSRPAVTQAGPGSVWIAWQADNIKYTGIFGKLADLEPVTSSIWIARVRLSNESLGLGEPVLEEVFPGKPTDLRSIASGAVRGRAPIKRRVVESDGKKYTLIMGNLHEHTNIPSNCVPPSNVDGTFFDNYRHAMDVQGCDFAALTDHDFGLYYDAAWRKSLRAADFYNAPPYFVVVPACEYAYINKTWGKEWVPALGHHNLYFGSRESALRFSKEDGSIRSMLDEETNDVNKLLAMLHKLNITDAVIAPHQLTDFYSVVDWDIVDTTYRTVMEIFQIRGSYEYKGCPRQSEAYICADGSKAVGSETAWAQSALARGQRMGFIASADHRSTGHGLTVLMVRDISRKGIIEAMQSRRCYATTGDKIFVDFRINGHLMGEELKASDAPCITAEIDGTASLESVVVFKNNKIIYEKKGLDLKGSTKLNIDFVDDAFIGNSFYYLRVIQNNNEIAWSSPIWVDKDE
ncbi:MAG: CehA/McbA family metallohydrolase domain-containing protein [Armatimonadota bacterium]